MSTAFVDQHRIRAVCFDVDGTLYDLRRQQLWLLPHVARYPLVMRRYKATVKALRGQRHEHLRDELARRLGEEVGVNAGRTRQIIDEVVHGAWPDSFSKRTPYPGIHQLIAAVDARGLPRAVVSDYPSEIKLRKMGLDHGWTTIVSCEDEGAYKPLPDGLLKAAEALGVEPSEIVLIGDREDTDAAMATAAGAHSLILGRDARSIRGLHKKLLG